MLQDNFPKTFRPDSSPVVQTFISPQGQKVFEGKYNFTRNDSFERKQNGNYGATEEITINQTGYSLSSQYTQTFTASSGGGSSTSDSFSSSSSSATFEPGSITLFCFKQMADYPAFFYSHLSTRVTVAGTTKTTTSNRITNTFTTYTVQDFVSIVTQGNYKRAIGGDIEKQHDPSEAYAGVTYQDPYSPVGFLKLGEPNKGPIVLWRGYRDFIVDVNQSFQHLHAGFNTPAIGGNFQGNETTDKSINLNTPNRVTLESPQFDGAIGQTIITQNGRFIYGGYKDGYKWDGQRVFTYSDQGLYFFVLEGRLRELKTVIEKTTSSPWEEPYQAPFSFTGTGSSGSSSFTTMTSLTVNGNFIFEPQDLFLGQNVIEFNPAKKALYSSVFNDGYLAFDEILGPNSPFYSQTNFSIDKYSVGTFKPYFPGYRILRGGIRGVFAYSSHTRGYDIFPVTTTIYGNIPTSTTISSQTNVTNVSQLQDFTNNNFAYYTVLNNSTTTTVQLTMVSSATYSFLDTISALKIKDRAATFIFKRIDWDGQRKTITAVIQLNNPLVGLARFSEQEDFIAGVTNTIRNSGFFGGYNPIEVVFGLKCDYTAEFFLGNWNISSFSCNGRQMNLLNAQKKPLLSWSDEQRYTVAMKYDHALFFSHEKLFRPRVINTLAFIGGFPSDPLEIEGGPGFNIFDSVTAARGWTIMEEDAQRLPARTTYYVNGF